MHINYYINFSQLFHDLISEYGEIFESEADENEVYRSILNLVNSDYYKTGVCTLDTRECEYDIHNNKVIFNLGNSYTSGESNCESGTCITIIFNLNDEDFTFYNSYGF